MTLTIKNPYFIIKKIGVEIYQNGNEYHFDTANDCFYCEALNYLLITYEDKIQIIQLENESNKYQIKYEIIINYLERLKIENNFVHIYHKPPFKNISNYVRSPSVYYLVELQQETYAIRYSRIMNKDPLSWPPIQMKNNIIISLNGSSLEYYPIIPQNDSENNNKNNSNNSNDQNERKDEKEFVNNRNINIKPIESDECIEARTVECSPYLNTITMAVFFPGKDGFPGTINIYQKELGKPMKMLNTISFLRGTSVEFFWLKQGHIVLAKTSTELDETGISYYGQSMLHCLYIPDESINLKFMKENEMKLFHSETNNIFTQTILSNDVHSVSFDPEHQYICLIHGKQPAQLEIYESMTMKQIFTIEKEFMNYSMFSHNSQFLAIAGFDNLDGTVFIFDVKNFKKISTFNAQCSTEWMWTLDNSSIVCGQCLPRRHYDHVIERFGIDGMKIEERKLEVRHCVMFGTPSLDEVEFEYDENVDQKVGGYVPVHLR